MFEWVQDVWNFLKNLLSKIFDFVANVANYFGIDLRTILKNSSTKLKVLINRYLPLLKSSHIRAFMQKVSSDLVELITKVYIRKNGNWHIETKTEKISFEDVPPHLREKVLKGKKLDVTQDIEEKLELELAN